jgi:site-specific recombinase XerD
MAKLLFTTSAFRPQNRSVSGVPILVDANMRLVEPACAWFIHLALIRGRTRSAETWRTYGEALYDWWQTLEANDWLWNAITPLHVAAYRDRMLSGPSEHTKRPYARSTINARVRAIAAFYEWCVGNGELEKSPFIVDDVRVYAPTRDRTFAHLDGTGGRRKVNELTVRHTLLLPRPVSIEDLRRVMAGSAVRDRLLIEWSLTTGVRRMEAAALEVAALQGICRDTSLCRMRIHVTKGDKPRDIYPPRSLVDRTRAYLREERAVLVRRRKRACEQYSEPSTIFLRASGERMTARNVGEMFAARAARCGLKATYHSLRHTYATTMLQTLQREARNSAELNPLLTLQVLLGHADISSTSIYLRVLATDLAAVERSVDDLYKALC